MKKILAMMWTVIVAGQFFLANEALAQEAPTTEENVCAPLEDPNITKGLLGLCLAYCQDDGMVSGDMSDKEVTKALKKSSKILKKYNSKKSTADPEMPCVHSPCPCWTSEQMADFGIGAKSSVTCQNVNDNFRTIAYSSGSAATTGLFVDTENNVSLQICSIQDVDKGIGFKRIDGISADQASACRAELIAQCQAHGVHID